MPSAEPGHAVVLRPMRVQPAAPAGDGSDASTRMAPHSPDALETGTTFASRYQIIEELGRGGMGRVYKVVDQEVHAKVALKLIRPEIAFDQATIERFRQELKTAREISHKNIWGGGMAIGTPQYMSPEQAEGSKHRAPRRQRPSTTRSTATCARSPPLRSRRIG